MCTVSSHEPPPAHHRVNLGALRLWCVCRGVQVSLHFLGLMEAVTAFCKEKL